MCGRYTLTSPQGVVSDLGLALALAVAEPALASPWWRPRFNIAPTQLAPIVANREGPHLIELGRWGLVPPWAKDLSIGASMINARAETAADKRGFREALRHRRCLVPADGFFEWRQDGKRKQPMWIHPAPARTIAFAGLWERWRSPDGTWVISFCILTGPPSPLVAPIHDRMPVVLPREALERWLAPAPVTPADVADLLGSASTPGWRVDPVADRVNKPANDDPACVAPVVAAVPPQLSLFGGTTA